MTLLTKVSNLRNLVPDKYRNKKLAYFVILTAITLDNLSVAGAMNIEASIAERFDASASTVSWVLSAYALTLGAFIIFFGKLADIVGVHNVFIGGCAFMSLFSLLTAVITHNLIAVIVFRAFQGIAGAALLPSGYALTANYFHGESLESAIKGLTIALCGSFGLGIILGGAFSESSIGYQGLFYFTFAMAAFCSIFLFFFIIPIEKTEGHKNMKLKNLNLVSVFLLVVGLLLVILGFTEAGENWNSPKVYVPIPVGVLTVLSMFLFENVYLKRYKNKHKNKIERTLVSQRTLDTKDSKNLREGETTTEFEKESNDWRLSVDLLFPFETFKIINFGVLLAGVFCCYFSFIIIMVDLIQYHIYLEKDSTIIAALKVFPIAFGILIGAILYRANIMEKYFGARNAMIISGIGNCLTSIWVSRVDFEITNSYWKFECISLFLLGYFTNIFFMVYLNSVMSSTPLHLQGVVSGIYQTAAQVAIAIASAIASTIIGNLLHSLNTFQEKENQFQKYRNCLYAGVAANSLFFIVTLFVKDPKKVSKSKETREEEEEEQVASSV